MKKFYSKLLLAISAVIVTLSLSACGLIDNPLDDSNDLVGTWVQVYDSDYSFTFDKKGNFIKREWQCDYKSPGYIKTNLYTYQITASDKHGKVTRYKVVIQTNTSSSPDIYYFFRKGKLLRDVPTWDVGDRISPDASTWYQEDDYNFTTPNDLCTTYTKK